MSRNKLAVVIAVFIVIGAAWGLASVFLLGNHYVVCQNPAERAEQWTRITGLYPPEHWDSIYDLYPPGDYSTFGKSVFFPGWASAQLSTVDGIIYYAGPNTDMYNPFLYLCSIGIGAILVLLVVFIPMLAYVRVRKMRGTS
jgi:hypothetical protein